MKIKGINVNVKKINGRQLAKILIGENMIVKEDVNNWYFKATYFEKIKEDEWFEFEYPYAKVNKNKLYSW